MKLRKARSRRRGRIEIIPMIDVMFFLLATFMLASLSLQNLHSLPVDLPRGQTTPLQAKTPVTLSVTRAGDRGRGGRAGAEPARTPRPAGAAARGRAAAARAGAAAPAAIAPVAATAATQA